MRLYHHPMSSNARRAVMTAVHQGLKLDLTVVDLAKGAQRDPQFLSINPSGKVPVLDDARPTCLPPHHFELPRPSQRPETSRREWLGEARLRVR